MVTMNNRDPRPIYEQVKDNYRKLIVSGVLSPDEKLPSVRELATELAINPNTIQRAYRELEQEGIIYSVPGKGSFAAEKGEAIEAKRAGALAKFDEAVKELSQLGVAITELIERLKGREKE